MSQHRDNWITARDMVRSRAWRHGYEDFRRGAALDYAGHRSKTLAYEYGRLTAAYLQSEGHRLVRVSPTRPINEAYVRALTSALLGCLAVEPSPWNVDGPAW